MKSALITGINGQDGSYLAELLLKKGYEIETLSPDDFQKKVIKEKFNDKIPFHHCKFENFQVNGKFDMILESESACYIKIDEGFNRAREILRDGGYLLASDYFVHFRDTSKSPHQRASHDLHRYLESAKERGFDLIKEFSSKVFPVSLGVLILNSFGEYFSMSFGNKSQISLYFPSLFVPIKIFLIFVILH